MLKNSPWSKKLFPDLEGGTAAAVCLARFAQEPLAEYSALWTSADSVEGFGYESLFLDLHPQKVCLFFHY
jgi:transcriptional accessory protein Tex/SPT6